MAIALFLSLFPLIILMLVKLSLILRIRMFKVKLLINSALLSRSIVFVLSTLINSPKIKDISIMSTLSTRMTKICKVLGSAGAIALALLCTVLPCFAAPPAVDHSGYNLIEGNLSNWSEDENLGTLSVSSYGNGLTRFICKTEVSSVGNSSLSMFLVASYSVPSGFLVAGKSYSFSFYVPTNAEIKPNTSSFNYASDFGTSVVRIGLGTFKDGVFTPFNDVCVDLTKDTVSQYQGQTTTLSFVCPDYSGDIRAMIIFADSRKLSYSYNLNYYFGSGIMLVDNDRRDQIDNYNQWFYGGNPEDYTNPYTTENFDVGDAGNTDSIEHGFSQWEQGLGEFGTPVRVCGVFLNSLFSTGGIVTVGVIVLVILMFGVIFRLFGVT